MAWWQYSRAYFASALPGGSALGRGCSSPLARVRPNGGHVDPLPRGRVPSLMAGDAQGS